MAETSKDILALARRLANLHKHHDEDAAIIEIIEALRTTYIRGGIVAYETFMDSIAPKTIQWTGERFETASLFIRVLTSTVDELKSKL